MRWTPSCLTCRPRACNVRRCRSSLRVLCVGFGWNYRWLRRKKNSEHTAKFPSPLSDDEAHCAVISMHKVNVADESFRMRFELILFTKHQRSVWAANKDVFRSRARLWQTTLQGNRWEEVLEEVENKNPRVRRIRCLEASRVDSRTAFLMLTQLRTFSRPNFRHEILRREWSEQWHWPQFECLYYIRYTSHRPTECVRLRPSQQWGPSNQLLISWLVKCITLRSIKHKARQLEIH